MKSELDSATLEIPCPHCSKKSSHTVGKLKTQSEHICSHCGASFNIDQAHIRREIAKLQRLIDAKVNKAAADIKKAFGRLAK